MSFMSLQVVRASAYVVTLADGSEQVVMCEDVWGDTGPHSRGATMAALAPYVTSDVMSYTVACGYWARYSAAGYLDCTPWVGPYLRAEGAAGGAAEQYGEEDDECADTERSPQWEGSTAPRAGA